LVSAVLLGLLFPAGHVADFSERRIRDLRDEVVQRERDLDHAQDAGYAQAALALARARLAMAEGKLEQAAPEWRKVVAYYEGQLKIFRAFFTSRRYCGSSEERARVLEMAQGNLADARASLAEAERKPECVVAELEWVVFFREKQAIRLRRQVRYDPAPSVELKQELATAEKTFQEASQRLDAARKAWKATKPPSHGNKW
jgi:hypothetical protein